MTLIICEKSGITMADILEEKDDIKCALCGSEVYIEDALIVEGKGICWLCCERIKLRL